MKYVVTGATGFLGNNIVRMLLAQGHEVTCILRQSQPTPALAGLQVQPVYADLRDAGTLSRQLGDFDQLIHSAALIQLGWSQLSESRQVNVAGTQTLVELCWSRRKRLIHISTVDTLAHAAQGVPIREGQRQPANPNCSYVQSKREAEQAVNDRVAQGLDAVIVHPGFMVGPYDWKPSSGQMMLSVAQGLGVLAPGGGCSIVDVRDVAAGVVAAGTRGLSGESYILAGENISYFQLWQEMALIAKVRGPRGRLPNWLASAVGTGGDLVAKFRRREPLINSANTAMGQLFHYYSSEKAQSQLDYRIHSWQQAIRDAWAWFGEVGMQPKSKSSR